VQATGGVDEAGDRRPRGPAGDLDRCFDPVVGRVQLLSQDADQLVLLPSQGGCGTHQCAGDQDRDQHPERQVGDHDKSAGHGQRQRESSCLVQQQAISVLPEEDVAAGKPAQRYCNPRVCLLPALPRDKHKMPCVAEHIRDKTFWAAENAPNQLPTVSTFRLGRMFWLRWNTFSGSTASLSAVSRASTAGG
jgi:hypothetical protein